MRLPHCFRLAKNSKRDNTLSFFWHCFVSLVKFKYCTKFNVNIITSSGIMTIFFYKGLTRNLEIGNSPIWVFLDIWRLQQVGNTKFGTNVPYKILLNVAKFQGYSFYHFWVIKGKQTGENYARPLPPFSRLGLILFL